MSTDNENRRGTTRRGLGRGLSALMADVQLDPESLADDETLGRRIVRIPIEKLSPNPGQPRRMFESGALEDLANSIAEKGVLQPLIVRPVPGSEGRYQIVAGERRWRAAQMAQLHELPALVRDLDDTEVLEVAIIENIQRADLNAVEEAAGYRQLMERFGHTQEVLGRALGKSRSHIANLLRLLSLPAEVQTHIREGRLTAGHARALVTADDPAALARRIIRDGLSVRAVEKLVQQRSGKARQDAPAGTGGGVPGKDVDTRAMEQELSSQLGLAVRVDHRPGTQGGQVVIRYATLEELDALCATLSRPARARSPAASAGTGDD